MEKKRLEELREETAQYRAVADDRCMSTQYEDDILALIDSALAEPSDEDIDRALDWILTGKYETQVGDHSYVADSRFHPDTSRFCNTIAQALRQYQKPTDEAVRSAIEWMEIEKESAQNSWERAGAEWRMEPGTQEMHDEQMAAFDLAIQALCQMTQSDADVEKIIATGEYLYGLNDDNLADLVIQTNEVQNYIVESFTALRQMKGEPK